jgi:hypothetical protein
MGSSTTTNPDTKQYDKMDEITYSTKEIRESQVLSDGLTAGSGRHQHVVLLQSSEELDPVERETLDEATDEFLTETDFDTQSLLVVQVTLPSSAMDFTVERMGVRDEQVHVWVEYSENAGPQNEIVETELVRFGDLTGGSPAKVVVHAEHFPYTDGNETTFTISD